MIRIWGASKHTHTHIHTPTGSDWDSLGWTVDLFSFPLIEWTCLASTIQLFSCITITFLCFLPICTNIICHLALIFQCMKSWKLKHDLEILLRIGENVRLELLLIDERYAQLFLIRDQNYLSVNFNLLRQGSYPTALFLSGLGLGLSQSLFLCVPHII